MHPVIYEFHGFEISSFGVMLAIAFLVGTWVASIRMREEGLDPDKATTLLLYAMLGGIGGSKLYWAVDVSIREDAEFWSLLLRRDGITFYGGLLGGMAAVILGCVIHHVPIRPLANSIASTMAIGQGIGRIGCFLVGDDYGRATDLPWGISFPAGNPPTLEPVHPTQLYEMTWLFAVAGLLWRRRRSSPFVFGEYLVLNGLGRMVIELWRTNEPLALGLTQPQWIGMALAVAGGGLWLRFRARQPSPA